jgi:hypothetical protein
MSDYGVKIGIKADTGIMLLKPSTVSAVQDILQSICNFNFAMSEINKIYEPKHVCVNFMLSYYCLVFHYYL